MELGENKAQTNRPKRTLPHTSLDQKLVDVLMWLLYVAVHDNMLACFGGHTPSPVYMIFSQSHYYSKEFWVLDLQKSRFCPQSL